MLGVWGFWGFGGLGRSELILGKGCVTRSEIQTLAQGNFEKRVFLLTRLWVKTNGTILVGR